MSIAALVQVHEETRRLAIAGSNLAAGDFRLKKLIPPLEASAKKAPVFGKVAEAITALIESDNKTSAAALLELSTLVSAILYTQGETGCEGKFEEIETMDFGLPSTNTSARVLKPLIEALTTTGSGREEIIRDALERGAFKDLRLVRVAIGGLDDPYGPIADFVAAKVLPIYGKAIYDDLLNSFDPKAKGGQVRRLKLMHQIDPERTHELVEQALESGSPDMKVAAIECLEGFPESLSFLLEQSKAKSSDVRRAALQAMASLDDELVLEALKGALSGKDLELAAPAASKNRDPKLLEYLLESVESQLAEFANIPAKDKPKARKANSRMRSLLRCFQSRDDAKSLAFLSQCYERREELLKLKGEIDGEAMVSQIAGLLVQSKNKAALKLVADSHETVDANTLSWALAAAVQFKKPKEIYDDFSAYYFYKPEGRKKSNDLAEEKKGTVREMLESLSGEHYRHHLWAGEDYIDVSEFSDGVTLDPRWLEAAVKMEDLDLVESLARPKHKDTEAFLSKAFKERLAKRDFDYDITGVLDTMLRIDHPEATDGFLEVLQKLAKKKNYYYGYWLTRLIPRLPKEAFPKIEALLPSMPDGLVDQIAPYLTELQAKV